MLWRCVVGGRLSYLIGVSEAVTTSPLIVPNDSLQRGDLDGVTASSQP